MKEITFKTITLNWQKIIEGKNEAPKEAGVYQIYGDSPIYGTNMLLYIGKADNLYNRIQLGHLANEESHIMRQPNISFRYATTNISLNHIAEEILIVMHKPSFNAMSIGNINNKSKEFPIYIQNFGERGMLNLEVTNIHFLTSYI
jgi:excinuclease UvrABC nuclease subunit